MTGSLLTSRAGNVATSSSTSMQELIMKYECRIQELERENSILKQKQVEVQTAKELYLKIFEVFPALIWRSRLDKKCDYFNKTWLDWTGKTMEQEYGDGWTNGVHKDDFDRCVETYVAAFDKRESFYMEYRLLDKHGAYRWIGDHGRPFHDIDGTFLGYIGSCYDITENKQNEEKLAQLNATKDKFFSIVAHDLRNPIISAFVGVSELLMEDYQDFEPGEITEIATQMHKDSTATLKLLENLLEWSRVQSSSIQFNPKPLQVWTAFEEVLSQVNFCTSAKKIGIHFACDESISVKVDHNMFKTIVRNLLMNAIKFSKNGEDIHIKAETSQNRLQVDVKDSGVGMSESDMKHLFDLCKSSSKQGTANEIGSGLGLIMCKDFVEKHEGSIQVKSKLGEGTTFTFSIPIKE